MPLSLIEPKTFVMRMLQSKLDRSSSSFDLFTSSLNSGFNFELEPRVGPSSSWNSVSQKSFLNLHRCNLSWISDESWPGEPPPWGRWSLHLRRARPWPPTPWRLQHQPVVGTTIPAMTLTMDNRNDLKTKLLTKLIFFTYYLILTVKEVKFMLFYRVCHEFEEMRRDDFFRITFDYF